jgi:hypothetical protein
MTVPTIYGGEIMAAKRHGLNVDLHENSMLNNIVTLITGVSGSNRLPIGVTPAGAGEINQFTSRYFILGTGAHLVQPRSDGASFFMPVPHSPADSGPYYWLPFKLVKLTGAGAQPDITGPERRQYVMRRIITVAGDQYAGYWIKRLPFASGLTPSRKSYLVNNGSATAPTSFSPGNSHMRPTRPTLVNGVIPTTGRYYEASIPLTVNFTEEEINDLRYVGQVLFNNPNAIVISEIGLVYGVERVGFQEYITGGGTLKPVNTDITLTELASATVGCWVSEVKQIGANSQLKIELDIGAVEPEFSTV